MPKMSIWDKVRLYGGSITGASSSFVTAACIGFIGRSLIKNPITKVIWYIGGTSIGVLVGRQVETMFEEAVTETEEAVTEVQKAVDEVLNASEVV